MTPEPDPYRTLGLARGASLDEVKRAYRRLAKINHPDAAGEAALPRFLAIQAAYERLVGGTTGPTNGRRTPPTPRRAWDADRDQADATRRAYGGRARGAGPAPRSDGASAGPTGAGSRSWTGRASRDGPAAPGSRPAGSADDGAREPSGRSRRRPSEPRPGPAAGASGSGKSRPPNKATPGSTSYDGADAGPFEPDWGGASWYGTTSGTYWTLNPKEYADPRKHGPEYQARARRATRARTPGEGPSAAEADPSAAEPVPTVEAVGGQPAGTTAGATHTTSSWWESTAGPTEDPASAPPAGRGRPYEPRATGPGGEPPPPPPDLGRAAGEFGRALTDTGYGGLRGRVVRALIGWLPIALGLGWLVGELTGCGRFSASCDPATDPILLGLQLAILGVLLALPAVASAATMAALTLVLASIGAAFVLSATGGAADGDSRRTALGVVLVGAWLLGLAIAVVRGVRALPSRASPVS